MVFLPEKQVNFSARSRNSLSGLVRPITTLTVAYTIILSDANSFLVCSSTTAFAVTIPADTTTNFPIGTEIDITQDNTGAITITAASGCNVRRIGSTATTGHVLIGRYAITMLKKIAVNEWRLYGGVA
jgi:hypothetical protein